MVGQHPNLEIHNISEDSEIEELVTIQQINKLKEEIEDAKEIRESGEATFKSVEEPKEINIEEINNNRKIRRAFSRLNFHYNTANILENWHSIIKKLSEKYSDDDYSTEWVLFNNPQVKKLLSNIVSSQVKDIKAEKVRCQRLLLQIANKNQQNDDTLNPDDENVIWERYKFKALSIENFENFVLSSEWIAVIVKELKGHINLETWELYTNYPIDEKILKLRLQNAWDNHLFREYHLEYGIYADDEKDNMDRISNVLEDEIDNMIWDYIKGWWKVFDKNLINELEWIFSDTSKNESINEILENSEYKDAFQKLLKDRILNFSNGTVVWDRISLNNSSLQTNLQLKSYLFMYGKIFHPQIFKTNQNNQYYEDILPKIMEAILSLEGDERIKNIIKYNEFLESEKKAEEERRERDRLRRQEIIRRIKEKNKSIRSEGINRIHSSIDLKVKTDPNHATWQEIAEEAGLWQSLSDYSVELQESKYEEPRIKDIAFSDAWNEFIKNNDGIIITKDKMRELFDINNNAFVSELDNRRKKFTEDFLLWMSPDEIKNIYSKLSSFSRYFVEAEKKLSNNSSEKKEKINETVRTYAVGAVIDNMRDTFEAIPKWEGSNSEWFKLDSEHPVIKVNNYIIISGLFNGSNIKIRYDLKTGEICMNSFIKKDLVNNDKMSIWDISSLDDPESINQRIWEIKPFGEVLNDYYKLPNNSDRNYIPRAWEERLRNSQDYPRSSGAEIIDRDNLNWDDTAHKMQIRRSMWSQPKMNEGDADFRRQEAKKILSSQIDLIDDKYEKHIKCQTLKNLAITNFMKTFNIMSSWGFNSIDLNRSSNIFSVVEIIDNTYNIGRENDNNSNKEVDWFQSLEYFNNIFMPKVIEYSWLKWWVENEYQDKKNKKSERIFTYEWNNSDIKYLKDKVRDFNPKKFKGVANFDTTHQIEFADLIKEKISIWQEPNRRLYYNMMKNFIKSLDSKENEESSKD